MESGLSKDTFDKIKMLVLDVDGVLSDGTIIVHSDGSESKQFHTLDGHGIRMWKRAGHKVAFLSGRSSGGPTQKRAQQLEIDYVFENGFDKPEVLEELLEKAALSADEVAYVGDDLMDVKVIAKVGFGVAVANAVNEVKQYADYITHRPGGHGAVREVIEYILKNSGQWQDLVKRYLPD